MKNVIPFFLAFSLFVSQCSDGSQQDQEEANASQDAVKDLIPGIYVRPFGEQLSETTKTSGNDTLRIKKQTASGSETYQIDRSTRIERTLDGKEQPVENKKASWTGSFRPADKTVYVNNTGAVMAFDIKNNVMKIDGNEYKKIE